MPAAAPRVVVAPLAAAAAAAASAGDRWLADDEARRLAAMASPVRRAQFLAGHWLVRVVAGERLGVDPARLRLVRDDAGRPRLFLGGDDAGSASLSHSGDWLACAVAGAPVGIDIEFPRRVRDLDALAAFTFSASERAWLAAQHDDDRGAAFYRLWTLKEARGKRLGEGLLPGRARAVSAVACAAGFAEAATWRIGDGSLALAVDGVATLAVAGLPGGDPGEFWRYVAAGAAP